MYDKCHLIRWFLSVAGWRILDILMYNNKKIFNNDIVDHIIRKKGNYFLFPEI